MTDEDAREVSAALVSFLQAFARLIAQELQKKPDIRPAQRAGEPLPGHGFRRLLSVRETADLLQVRLNRVYEISNWKGPDGLRCVRVGRQLRFRMQDIEAYLERQSRGGP